MRTTRPFAQVDVFTAQPYLGNPLAVVLDVAGLSDESMQTFARWTNLSETTFVLPPSPEGQAGGADYRVRIFTPGGELPFAGHPTLGSCHAWLEAGGTPRAAGVVVQECQAGMIQIQRQTTDNGTRLAFGAPPLKRSNPSPKLLAQVAAALGLKPQQIIAAQHLDNGPQWLGILVGSVHTVLQVQPDHNALKDLGQKVGLVAVDSAAAAPVLIARSSREARAFAGFSGTTGTPPAPTDADAEKATLEVRGFAAPLGINEDPVTGSLNASLAQWLIADGYAPGDYIAAQGTCLGREGRVFIHQDATGQVWVGGHSVTCIRGQVTL